jgi:hypothetical protein
MAMSFRAFLLPYVDGAKEYFRKEYQNEYNPNRIRHVEARLRHFDELKLVYQLGQNQALMQLDKYKSQNFYQLMKAAENRVMAYRKIAEREGAI